MLKVTQTELTLIEEIEKFQTEFSNATNNLLYGNKTQDKFWLSLPPCSISTIKTALEDAKAIVNSLTIGCKENSLWIRWQLDPSVGYYYDTSEINETSFMYALMLFVHAVLDNFTIITTILGDYNFYCTKYEGKLYNIIKNYVGFKK